MTRKPIQLADIARHANVGVSTVSMALRDEPRSAIQTQEKVRAAVEALGSLEAAQELGVRVPTDLSMVSIDDVREAAESEPSLTTVSIQIEELGRQAGRALTAVVEGRSAAARDIRVPAVLQPRASVAPPATD